MESTVPGFLAPRLAVFAALTHFARRKFKPLA